MTVTQLWLRLPAIIRSLLTGFLAGLLGTLVWAALVAANLKLHSHVPWAVPIMALVLAIWWAYFVRGQGWPSSTREVRRLSARANSVPDRLWGPALGAGLLGLIGVLLLQGVLGRLVTLPQQQDIDPSKYPLVTVLAWLAMSALYPQEPVWPIGFLCQRRARLGCAPVKTSHRLLGFV